MSLCWALSEGAKDTLMLQQQTLYRLSPLLRPDQLCIFGFGFVFVLIFRRMYTVLVCIRNVSPRLQDLNTLSSVGDAIWCGVEGVALLEKVFTEGGIWELETSASCLCLKMWTFNFLFPLPYLPWWTLVPLNCKPRFMISYINCFWSVLCHSSRRGIHSSKWVPKHDITRKLEAMPVLKELLNEYL